MSFDNEELVKFLKSFASGVRIQRYGLRIRTRLGGGLRSPSVLVWLFDLLVVAAFLGVKVKEVVGLGLASPCRAVVADLDARHVLRHRRRVRLAERPAAVDVRLLLMMPAMGLEVEQSPAARQRMRGVVAVREVRRRRDGRDVFHFVVGVHSTLQL